MRTALLLTTLALAACDSFSAPPEPPSPPDVIVRDVEILGAPPETVDRQPWDGGFQSPAADVYAEIATTTYGGLNRSVRTRTFGNTQPKDFPLRDDTFSSTLLVDATQEFAVRLLDDDSGGLSNDDVMWEAERFAFTDLANGIPTTHTFTDLDGQPRVRITFELVPHQGFD